MNTRNFVFLAYFDPRGRPTVVISVFTFQNLVKQNNFQVRIMIATGGTVFLAEWIIDDTHFLL